MDIEGVQLDGDYLTEFKLGDIVTWSCAHFTRHYRVISVKLSKFAGKAGKTTLMVEPVEDISGQ